MSQKETKAEQNKTKKLRPVFFQKYKNCLHKMSTVIKLLGFEKSSENIMVIRRI